MVAEQILEVWKDGYFTAAHYSEKPFLIKQ
jgi:hypothetical protein